MKTITTESWSRRPHDSVLLVVPVPKLAMTRSESRFVLVHYAGVKEVWLVLVPERQIEVHREPTGKRFRERILHGPGGRVTNSVVPQFAVDLDSLFAEQRPA